MNFESELKKGNFVVTECTNCKKIVWPTAKFCNQCFSETVWKEGPKKGTIMEFSKEKEEYFCLAKFDDSIRIIGKITSGIPKEGQSVEIEKCGIYEKNYFFDMKLV